MSCPGGVRCDPVPRFRLGTRKEGHVFRMRMALLVLITLLVALVGPGPAAAAAGPPRIDLRVLVLTDGSPWVEGIRLQLDAEGVPTTVVNLADAARPEITPAYLADQLGDGTPHAKFDGVVLPSATVFGMSAAEQTALADFETQFGVRQVGAFSFPSAAVGLSAPAFSGSLDGVTATVTPAGLGDSFRYLTGPVTFEDNDPADRRVVRLPRIGAARRPGDRFALRADRDRGRPRHRDAARHRRCPPQRRPRAAGADLRLQLPPAAVPAARARGRRLADPRHPPRVLAQLHDRARRRPVRRGRAVECHRKVHPGRGRLRARHPGHRADPDDPGRRRPGRSRGSSRTASPSTCSTTPPAATSRSRRPAATP